MTSSKPRCCGNWTEARYNSFIVSALRAATRRWQPKSECIKNARVKRGVYKCELCKKEGAATLPPKKGNKRRRKNIVADHINPVVSCSDHFVDWNTWINRAFVELDGLQALCYDCHAKKTAKEKELRMKNKVMAKDHPLEYNSWKAMRARCLNQVHHAYDNYGGRGITIIESWREDFSQFLEDMGERQTIEYSLDRIDNDGNYEPANCRWTDKVSQARNRRNTVILNLNGEEKCMSDWADDLGIPVSTIKNRLLRGSTVEEALSLDFIKKTRQSELPITEFMQDSELGYHFKEIALAYGYHPDTVRKAIAKERRANEK